MSLYFFFFFPLQASLTFQARPWWSSTAPSVWMCTHQSHPGTITLTELTLALASLTCSSWCIPSTGQRGLPTSLCPGLSFLWFSQMKSTVVRFDHSCCLCLLPGFMVSRFTQWLTSSSCRQPPASRVPSKPSAETLSWVGRDGVGYRVGCVSISKGSLFSCNFWFDQD